MIIDNLIELNTIEKNDLLAVPSKVLHDTFVGKAGIIEIGTMPNHGAVSKTLAAGESYTVPLGYHNGSGTITAKTLAEQTTATANAAHILAPYTAWVTGGKVTGTMVNRTGWTSRISANGKVMIPEGYHNGDGYVDQSLTGKSAATYTPSISNQTIAANQWLTGAQTILGDPNLKAENIKEGITIFNIKGSARCYPSGSSDIYNRGVNPYGIVASIYNSAEISVDSGQLTISYIEAASNNNSIGSFTTSNSVNLAGYSKLCIEHSLSITGYGSSALIFIGGKCIYKDATDEHVAKLPSVISITGYQIAGQMELRFVSFSPNTGSSGSFSGPIFRIWLE